MKNRMQSCPLKLFLAMYLIGFPAAGQKTPPRLKILPVEGQGAINIIRKGAERSLTVRIEEKYGAPGKGIPVTFTLPRSGPSGYFKKRGRSVTVTSDDDGYAVVRGFRPNEVAGQYNIRVSAKVPGGRITASIPQTNAVYTGGGRSWRKLGTLFTPLPRAVRRLKHGNAGDAGSSHVETRSEVSGGDAP